MGFEVLLLGRGNWYAMRAVETVLEVLSALVEWRERGRGRERERELRLNWLSTEDQGTIGLDVSAVKATSA